MNGICRIAFLVVVVGVVGANGWGLEEDPASALLAMMVDRDRAIQEVVHSETGGETEADREELKQIMGELFDYPALSKDSLGRYWRARTQEEQAEFIDLYRRLLEKNYADPKLYTKSDTIEYTGVEVDGTEAVVRTVVYYKSEESTIDYKLHRVGGAWLIYDMVIDDLSVVRNNRSQFRKEIRKSSYEGLVKKLRDKLTEEKE